MTGCHLLSGKSISMVLNAPLANNWSIIARFAGEHCRLRSLVRVSNKSLHRTQAASVTRLAAVGSSRQAARQTRAPVSSTVRVRGGTMMDDRIFYCSIAVLTLLTVGSCSDNPIWSNGGQEQFDHILEIQTDSSRYDLDSVSHGFAVAIHASLSNPSIDTFYAELGGWNGGFDQGTLSIAKGTDGKFQKLVPPNHWRDQELGILFEGPCTIRLLPLTEYSLWAEARRDSLAPGIFRLRVDYFRDSARTGSDTLRDTSNTFTIE